MGSTHPGAARRSVELFHNTFANAPDRGDVRIMQGEKQLVNGFVVNILNHYIKLFGACRVDLEPCPTITCGTNVKAAMSIDDA